MAKRVKKTEEVTEEVVVTTPAEEETKTVEETFEEPVVETKEDSEPAEEPVEEPAKEEVAFDPALVDESKESTDKKKVRIRLKEKYHCKIGKHLYNFEKGQCYNVPENVKMVLSRAGILDVL